MDGFKVKRPLGRRAGGGYVVLDGSAEFEVADERVRAEAGCMLWVGSESKRKLVAGPDGVRILAIGCTPSGTYERPESFRVAARA